MRTGGTWRSLHLLQSKRRALDYLREIKAWVDAHPAEVPRLLVPDMGTGAPV